jgi:hypothetical protein
VLPVDAVVLDGYKQAIATELSKAANAVVVLSAINIARAARGLPAVDPADYANYIRHEVLDTNPTEPRRVKRALIVERLHTANKINALVTHFTTHKFAGERWYAAESYAFNDPIIIALLNDIGANPNVILA